MGRLVENLSKPRICIGMSVSEWAGYKTLSRWIRRHKKQYVLRDRRDWYKKLPNTCVCATYRPNHCNIHRNFYVKFHHDYVKFYINCGTISLFQLEYIVIVYKYVYDSIFTRICIVLPFMLKKIELFLLYSVD